MASEIKKISINDKNYPLLLKKIKDAPRIIFYRGKILPKENCLAVVGTRLCSAYGKNAAFEIASALSQAGLTIVSGLAPGIDTASHKATIEQKGRTIAVLGTGLDEESIYPRDNIKLAEKIIEAGGCLLSEYPPGTRGNKFTFPQRNRIISGLALGTLVIEAKQKSGALITADYAKKQKRPVFALPGPIHSPNSRGCHYLIKKGAKLIENAQDILKELNLNLKIPEENDQTKGKSREEYLILEKLKTGPLDIDEIIKKTGLPASVVAANLSALEVEGRIRNLEGNTFALAR